MNFVTPEAPPFQLSHGTADVLVRDDQSRLLHDALTRAGVRSDLYLLDDYRHGFLNPAGRMDVSMREVMDDGRLDEEGIASSVLHSGGAKPRATAFGFATIDEFFGTSLRPTLGHRQRRA